MRCQGLAFGVGVIAQHARRGHRERCVFDGSVIVVHGHGRIVDHWRDGDDDHSDVRVVCAVAGVIAKGDDAGVTESGRIDQRAVGPKRQCTKRGSVVEMRCQGLAFGVGVIAQHARRGHRERCVFDGSVIVVHGHGRIVDHWRDGDDDHSDVRVVYAVAGVISKEINPVKIKRGCINKSAIWQKRQLSKCGHRVKVRCQRAAFWVSVIVQHARRRHRERCVFGGGVAVVGGEWGSINRYHGDGDSGCAGTVAAIIGVIGKGVHTVKIERGRVDKSAVRQERQVSK